MIRDYFLGMQIKSLLNNFINVNKMSSTASSEGEILKKTLTYLGMALN